MANSENVSTSGAFGEEVKLKSRSTVDPERSNEMHLAFGEIVLIGSRKYRIFVFYRRPLHNALVL